MTTNQQLVARMTLVPALAWRVAQVRHDYPTMTIFWKPDAAHLDENSDHNPDSRDIGHAVDLMTYGDETKAKAILAWLALDRTDQQYVIHAAVIYGRDETNGWNGTPYHGTNLHYDHVHVSYRHANPGVGKNSLTGTGYYAAAESYKAAGSPLNPEGDDMADVMVTVPAGYSNAGQQITLSSAVSSLMRYVLQDRDTDLAALKALQGLIDAAPESGTVDVATIKAALAQVLNDATVNVSVPAAG